MNAKTKSVKHVEFFKEIKRTKAIIHHTGFFVSKRIGGYITERFELN